MVSNTGGGRVGRSSISRETRIEIIGYAALVLSIISVVAAVVPSVREVAWVPALPAVAFAMASLGLNVAHKRYATLGLILGWFAFSYSFAMMLWG